MTVARNTRSARKRRIQEDEEHPGQQVQQEQQGQEESELKTTPTKLKKVVQTSSKKKTTKANAESETEAMDVDVDVDVEVPKEEGTSLSLASSPTATTTTSPLAPRNLSTITPESNINIDPVATPPSTPPLQQQPPPTSSSSSSKKKKKKKSKKRKSNLSSPDPESQSQLSSSSPLALTSPSPCSSSKKAKKPKKSKSSISISPKSNPTPIANPQIAVQVHRFRNANYIPRAILKLCATPLLLPPAPVPASNSNSTSTPNINVNVIVAPHLAISREGGSVELVSVDEKWKCVAVVEGMKNRNVDAMAWVCDGDPFSNAADAIDAADTVSLVSVPANSEGGHTISGNNSDRNSNSNSTYIDGYHEQVEKTQSQRRLFGASRDGTIFEIDFKSKRHVGVIGSGGGAVFCLTSLYGRGSSVSSSSGSPITNTGISADFCNLIAAGCEDGSVRIFQTLCKDKSNNLNAPSLELVSTLPSVGNAITSIAWLPPPPSGRSRSKTGASSLEGSVLFAGVADGTIRKFVVSSVLQSSRTTGSVPHAMSTGMILTASIVDSEAITATATTMAENGAKSSSSSSSPSSALTGLQWKASARLTVENQGRRTATKIWALKALDDGTLISGDSMGNIQFWDTTAGTLLQSFEHNRSNADVLDLAVSYDQRKVMASGIDSRVVCIELNTQYSPGATATTGTATATPNKWILSTQQRHHTHDVHSLAIVYKTDPLGCHLLRESSKNTFGISTSPYEELLCSGGIDTKVSSYSVSNIRNYRPKVAYKYPSNAPVVLSRKLRVMSIMRPDKVDFYQLGGKRPTPDTAGSGVALDEEKAHLGSVCISSNYNLMSFDINDDGTLLAVSHAGGMLLFSVEFLDSYENGDGISRKIVKPYKIDIPPVINTPYSALKFCRNDPSLLVCAHCNGTINCVRIKKDSDEQNYSVSLEHAFDEYAIKSNFSNAYPITHLDISPDGRWLAAAKNTIGKGSVEIFALSPSYNHWWTLPCTEAPLSSMRWLGDGNTDPALATALNNGAFYLFDVEQRCLSEWSQDLGFPASPNLPRELTHRAECPDRIAFNSATPNKFIMVSLLGFYFFLRISSKTVIAAL